jgi:hypothetical protein
MTTLGLGDKMRLRDLWIVGLVLGAPTAAAAQVRVTTGADKAAAQAVKPADLVGQWARQGEKVPAYTFRADSTFTLAGVGTGQGPNGEASLDAVGRWRLVGDTLLISQPELQLGGQTVPGADGKAAFNGDLIRLVKLSGRVLTTTSRDAKIQRVYERLDAAKP